MYTRRTTVFLGFCFLAMLLIAVGSWLGNGRRSAMRHTPGLFGTTASGATIVGRSTEYVEGVTGYYARPRDDAPADRPYPGIVMVHEWWGLTDAVRGMADELARQGYHVLAVDLFDGQVASTPEQARERVAALDQERALVNLKAAAAFIRSRGATRSATLGWCFGGGQALRLAVSGVPLDATVVYYGTPLITDVERLAAINGPVLGIFGAEDSALPPEQVDAFGQALARAQVSNEFHTYPGVGHAFANPSGDNFSPKEARDAWQKTLLFLENNLKP